jgi:hypothetical protein
MRLHQSTTRTRTRGLSLIDIMMTMAILAVVAAIVVPMSAGNDRVRVRAALNLMISDIEFAQSMTISFPKDPTIIVFTPADDSYFLARESDDSTPLSRLDNGEPYFVRMGEGRAFAAEDVDLTVDGVPGNQLAFSPHGGLASLSAMPVITFSIGSGAGATEAELHIDAMTGTITEIVP